MGKLNEKIIVAGFGGQGVLLLGKLLSYTAMYSDKNVSWIPSYGPEMRGGTANCNVVISDEPVGSPIVTEPNVLIALNRPSLEKFEQILEEGSLLIYNSSIIEVEPKWNNGKVISLAASDIANELGNPRLTNMVAAGAYVKASGVFTIQELIDAVPHVISKRFHNLIPLNIEAIEKGAAAVS
ncbi:2-oxoacid:acceptor oxidoreductase family protein [bacterium]|nr:2-oxoacid:acceptor oxidoreductase family protein [bacterium]